MMRTSKPSITDQEKLFVQDALNRADIGVGEYIGKFEAEWAKYNNQQFAVACDSGTNALFLAVKALGIGPGDEVIIPEFTMISSAWAVTYAGGTPVFVDCGDDINIDPNLIEAAITPNSRAIMPVHIYGRTCDMQVINTIAKKHNLFVIEDMAEAHGIKPTGDIACYSFHSSKTLCTGGGGMCLTNNEAWAEEIKLLTHLYLNKNMTMLHPKVGYNFRLSNIQAAIGYSQALRADELIQKRIQVAAWYDKHIPDRFKMPKREVVWVYDIDCGKDQELVRQKLKDADIESRYFFKPMSEQPMYKKEGIETLKAYDWSRRGLYLPTYHDMTESDVIKVTDVLKSI